GFPGETEEEFEETAAFIRKIGYAELHVFPFSRRTGTPAAQMADQVPKEVKENRVNQMIELSNQLAKQYASEFESDVLEVIPEEKSSKEGKLVGYSDNYMKVEFEGTPDMIGSIIRVKITEPGYPINKEVKENRVNQMIELSNQLAKQYASEFESDVLEVIPEEKSSKEGKLVGYSDNYMKVEFEGTPDMIGSIIRVKITEPGYPINKGV